MKSMPDKFRDWMPIRVYSQDSARYLDWCYMDDARFTHPFFTDTIRERMREPFNLIFRHQTPVESLREIVDEDDVVPPTGFIFHMSRCGSTLVAQMLASVPANIVISEAPPIDSMISARNSSANEDQRAQWLTWMINAFGRKRHADERNYFIKFDSWNTIDIKFITKVFPDVPWIFLYRNPVEVIVSHMRQRGSQMIPGAMEKLLPDLNLSEALKMPAEEYCARVLARFCEGALAHATDGRGLLVNYEQLPDAVIGSIASHFRAEFSSDELSRMNAATQFDAKTPRLNFEPDTERKRAEASDAVQEAAAVWVLPIYDKLEMIRTNASV
jgi:hypothetical protein